MRAALDRFAPYARYAAGALLFLGLAACNVSVANGLDESDANKIVLALDRASVEGLKESDPSVEGKFRVLVERDDAARAMSAMRDEELPRPHTASVLDALDKGALVPSQTTEHAQFVAGLAGDLERSLEGVEGVLRARVHLNVPAPDPLRDAPPSKTTASVLFEHRGATPPLSLESVQRLVSGGVPGLAPTDVAVVFLARTAPPAWSESHLTHVGPILVARASARTLQGVMLGFVLLVIALLAAALTFYARARRTNEDAAPAK